MNTISTNATDLEMERFLDELFGPDEEAEKRRKQKEQDAKEFAKIASTLVREAVKHFKTKQFRPEDKNDFDERYLYSKAELDEFNKLNKNSAVKILILKDDNGCVFCYKLYS